VSHREDGAGRDEAPAVASEDDLIPRAFTAGLAKQGSEALVMGMAASASAVSLPRNVKTPSQPPGAPSRPRDRKAKAQAQAQAQAPLAAGQGDAQVEIPTSNPSVSTTDRASPSQSNSGEEGTFEEVSEVERLRMENAVLRELQRIGGKGSGSGTLTRLPSYRSTVHPT
jgi:hypothetical protein